MTAKQFIKDKQIEIPRTQQGLEDLLEYFANEYFTKSDLRFLLLHHPEPGEVEIACLHFLGDEAQKWWSENKC